MGSLETRVSPSRRDPPPPHPYSLEGGDFLFFVCVNGLLAVPAFGSKILSLDSLSWWWAMYGGNVETQVCPITVAMFITSALLVACDISDGLIWSPMSLTAPPDGSPLVGDPSGSPEHASALLSVMSTVGSSAQKRRATKRCEAPSLLISVRWYWAVVSAALSHLLRTSGLNFSGES